ncbi:hypothetical protein PACTADRAFT_37907 [Pachysolen tannophilus NRRL Y-2460]|uniref:Small ribosomal subunit protein mS35 n=1 Tax=Pachysolen tannophilus NRRL Y-2460 TaxID=669874 RepID=A0A1E4U1M5_PACTA|nr:hypothetical protein PACTADRAFT_37907 [Pachysolen tannophilus NRRL Y-2460]
MNEQLPLCLEPAKWKGLPSEDIFKLYQERVLTLGPHYKKSKEELEALLTTSADTGFTLKQIQKIYEGGELSAFEVERLSADDDFTPQPYLFDDYPSQAHDMINEHREQRQYNRIAAYEMPLLAKYRKEYKRPSVSTKPVTYRYTTYLGESHPAERKVVLSLKVKDLGLDGRQEHKFKLLAGVRYDYQTDCFKMSSERYPEPAQNARFLSDTLNRLLAESKDLSKDDFSDIPIDTRYIKSKISKKKNKDYQFPEEWKRPEDAPGKKFDPFRELYRDLKI